MNRPGKPRVLQALSFIVMHVFFQNDMDVNKYSTTYVHSKFWAHELDITDIIIGT